MVATLAKPMQQQTNPPQIALQKAHQRIHELEQQATRSEEISETQKAIIASLQHENHWYQELFDNRTLSGTRMRIIAKTTPREIKMGLVDQVEEKKVYLPALAEEVGVSDKTLSKELRTIAKETGAYTYRREDEENAAGLPVSRVILGYCTPLASPAQIELAPRGHGGKRVKRCAQCGSDQIVERKQTQCTCCGSIIDGAWKPVNDMDSTGGQDDPSESIEEEDPIHAHHRIYVEAEAQRTPEEKQAIEERNRREWDSTHSEEEGTEITPHGHIDTDPMGSDEISKLPPITNPITHPQTENRDSLPTDKMTVGESVLTTWLEKQIGNTVQKLIVATGKREAGQKYVSLSFDHQVNIARYLAGDPEFQYGSALADEQGNTFFLEWDIDEQPDIYEQRTTIQTQLAHAGVATLCFLRANNRAHILAHFSEKIDAEAGKAYCLTACPLLEKIPECYPTGAKHNGRIGWPLYQRIGDQVIECMVEAMSPANPGHLYACKGVRSDPDRLAVLVRRCVTKASLVPARVEQPTKVSMVGGLLDKPLPKITFEGDLIEEFNRSHTWDDIADLCGGWSSRGYFKAVWRGERTASVKPDADERYCCDYGNHGSFPKKLDMYGVYCLVKDIDPAADLREQRAALRQGVAA